MTDIDIHEALDRAIGDGPPLPSPDTRLPAARAALRRRRVGVAATAVAAVVAVVVPVAVLSGGSQTPGTEPAPVAPPTASAPSVEPAQKPTRSRFRWTDDSVPAAVDYSTGRVHIRPGARVHERRRDVFPGKDSNSLALDLSWHGTRYWVLLEWDEGGGGSISTGPGDGFVDSFDAFVAQQAAGGGMTSGKPRGGRGDGSGVAETGNLVGLRWTADGFTASGRTEILQATDEPGLPEGFAPPSARTGAAYVRMDGELQLVVARDLDDSEAELIAVLAEDHGDTLDELLDWARRQYEAGEGLR